MKTFEFINLIINIEKARFIKLLTIITEKYDRFIFKTVSSNL